ncbi:hypothetical protein KAM621c_07270 [Citrobacter braakii]|uniref:Uncharacterized protein n=1 Tax=Citrobacter braakii TaxID=57706 RepID=A0AAD1KZN9_CITBR|nr:hypothetical protein KAM621c_07270 [Citrobacter braakii]
MITNIDSITIVLRVCRHAALNLQAIKGSQAAKHMTERCDVFWISWAEQTVYATENTDQNAVNNSND